MVEVGRRKRLNRLVRNRATPTTTTSPAAERPPPARMPCPTVRSTPWLAKAAPTKARGAMIASARRAEMACRAWGIPIQAPV